MPSTVRIFDLLPYTIREGDPDLALKTLFDAVQQEYERCRSEIRGLGLLIDVDGINSTYEYQGNPVFDYVNNPEKLLIGQIQPNTLLQLVTNIAPLNDFYLGYGLRVLRSKYDANGDGVFEEDQAAGFPKSFENFYTKIVNYEYDATTGVGTVFVFPPFPPDMVTLLAGGMNIAFEISQPRFVYLPATDAQGRSIIPTTDYYRDWFVRIYAGPGGTPIQTKRITTFFVRKDPAGNPISYILGVDSPFEQPPTATSLFGITPQFTSLNYIAQQVGFEPEATDPEDLQKQQILSAVPAYKLKGTIDSFRLLFKTFGFQSRVQERFSNYTHAPVDEPGVEELPPHDDSFSQPAVGEPRAIDNVALRELFSDDFSSNDTTRWDVTGTAGAGTITVSSGILNLKSTASGGAYIGKHCGVHDFVFEFDVNLGAISLAPGNKLSIFEIANDTRTSPQMRLTVNDAALTLKVDATPPQATTAILFPNTWTHFKVRMASQSVQVWQDGTPVFDNFPTGSTFLGGYGTSSHMFLCAMPIFGTIPTTVKFDNFKSSTLTDVLIKSGAGEDAVTNLAFRRNNGNIGFRNPDLRIPDSDITVLLRKLNPNVQFSADVFQRIVKRLKDIRPIHVEVALVAAAVDELSVVGFVDQLNRLYRFTETVGIADTLDVIPDLLLFLETVGITDRLTILVAEPRWDVSASAFDADDVRWDT